ncbi:MAG: MATE family efflux transporter [Cumulibacter sp.]
MLDEPAPPSVRRVLGLALPALVVLAAEPLYVLLDTAMIGHLGTLPLAGLAIGGTVLSQVSGQLNFLAYGTTARAARRYGEGDHAGAVREGVNASILALIIGAAIVIAVEVLAYPIARVIGGSDSPALDDAVGWLRIAILGAPGILLALAGNGWMRGLQRTREPTIYVTVGFGLCLILLPIMVTGLGWGLLGSAVANVVAQWITGGLFLRALLRERVSLRPQRRVMIGQLRTGRDLFVRTLALQGSFVLAAALCSRMGPEVLGAHQIGLQLFMLTALALDAVAIAAQSLVGEALGRREAARARASAAMCARVGLVAGVVFAAVLVLVRPFAPSLFASSADVLAEAAVMWWWLAGMQLIAGVLFALDGVLMGANDVAILRTITIVAHAGVYAPLAWLAYQFGWGIGGIWFGLTISLVVRLVLGGWRVRGDRWMSASAA